MTTIEQMCRELLRVAIDDGLVEERTQPERFSAGDLVGISNQLDEYLEHDLLRRLVARNLDLPACSSWAVPLG